MPQKANKPSSETICNPRYQRFRRIFHRIIQCVVASGLEVGIAEKLAASRCGATGKDLGGIAGVAQLPLDRNRVAEFLSEQRVQAGAAHRGVVDAANGAFEYGVRVIDRRDAVGAIAHHCISDRRGGKCFGARVLSGIR